MKENMLLNSGIGQSMSVRALDWRGDLPHKTKELLQQIMMQADEYFSTRGSTSISGQRELLEQVAALLISLEPRAPTVIPLLPGLGKSTLVRALLKVLADEFADHTDYARLLGGAIIVVEKTAEAYELRDLVNHQGHNLACVLESPNDFNISHGSCLRSEVNGFADCPGKACPDAAICPLIQSTAKANKTPILILMHARYQRYVTDMDELRSWVDADGKIHRRTLLLVDEAPQLMISNSISVSKIAELEAHISRLKPSYQRKIDVEKSRLLYRVDTQVRAPFSKLIHSCRDEFGRWAAVNKSQLKDAGFHPSELSELSKALQRYAGASVTDWLNRLQALSDGRAVYTLGQERALTLPTCIHPDRCDGLRTFILSGSASLSPELCSNPDFEVMPTNFTESFHRLTVCIQRADAFGTTKTAMLRKGNRKALIAWLRHRLAQMSADARVLLVTYKSYAAELWEELTEFHGRLIPLQADDGGAPEESLPYFGGMNGSNKYAEATCVICAGLGRFEAAEYLCRALAFDFNGEAWAELLEQTEEAGKSSDLRELACVQHDTNFTIARDLVQLVFRSALRNHGGTTPITLWLVQPPSEVVSLVQQFFGDCSVVEFTDLPETCLLESAAHRTVKGKPTHAARLIQWLKQWDGSEIAVADLQRELGLTSAQWKEARKNPAVRDYFDHHVASRRVGMRVLLHRV